MAHPITSRKRAHAFSLALLLVGVAVLIYLQDWWPGIIIVIGLPLALKQYLLGKRYDTYLTLFIFGVGFVTVACDISWQLLLPVLFVMGAVYIVCREIYEARIYREDEKEEDISLELTEDHTDKTSPRK